MKGHVRSFKNKISHPKVFEWVKIVSVTGGAQALVQLLGLLSGIITVRLLSTQEYALYTLAYTMLGTMTLLADSGVASGVMAQGGKVWQDKLKLGVVLATGYDLRKKFAWGAMFIACPILLYLLLHHGASWLMALIIVIALIPAFFAALSDSLLEIAPKLHQDINPLQKNQMMVSVLRFLLTCLTLFLFPFTFVAILAAGLPRTYGNYKLRKIANRYAETEAQPSKEIETEIFKIVKRTLPAGIYYSFSGQITIWMISLFGHTNTIAQIGAISRFALLLNLLSVVFGTVILPRFARLPENRNVLFKKVFQIVLMLLIVFSGTIFLFWEFSDLLLKILGPKYAGLNKELVLAIIGSSISLLGGVFFTLYSSRGWAIQPFILIPIDLSAVILGAFLFNISTFHGVLYYNIFVSSSLMLTNLTYFLFKISRIRKQHIIN
jgi:O-antigen/teichoic acid export membrane protein